MQQLAPRLLGDGRGLGRLNEVDERLEKALGRLAVRKMSRVVEYLEAASGNGLVGRVGVVDRNERVPPAPDEERRDQGGEIQAIDGADCLPTRIDDRAERPEEGPAGVGGGERGVAPPDLLHDRRGADEGTAEP